MHSTLACLQRYYENKYAGNQRRDSRGRCLPAGIRRSAQKAASGSFLTESNGAVGNARKRQGSTGSQNGEKPHKITRFGSGRDSPEPPRSGSNPAGANSKILILQGFPTQHRVWKTRFVEWPGGIAPPGSPKTVREILTSYGSYHPAVRKAVQ
jgi:hypothetical protein